MLDFCHISPTSYLEKFCGRQKVHLLLAHLVEQDENYARWYRATKPEKNTSNDPSGPYRRTYILDNSAFEMFKQNRPMYDSDKLIEMGEIVRADYIVLSDYPKEHSSKTIKAAEKLAPLFKERNFGTFFVPQSKENDIEDYIAAFAWAASSPLIDYIGLSILGIPNAFGVLDNQLQRFTSRFMMLCLLEKRGLLTLAKSNGKKIHMLGMLDGPNEILLCDQHKIDSWDSSAAIWAGLNGILFDGSPTGLISGKFEKHVDFNHCDANDEHIQYALKNMDHIDILVRNYNTMYEKDEKFLSMIFEQKGK